MFVKHRDGGETHNGVDRIFLCKGNIELAGQGSKPGTAHPPNS